MSNTLVENAKKDGASFLSEDESKRLLASFGVRIGKELLTKSLDEALVYAKEVGYPLVIKGCGRTLLHKTEMGLVEIGIRDQQDLQTRFDTLLKKLPDDADGLLLSAMVESKREFIAGLSVDPQFGPVVMFGLGGIFTEAMKDVVFRVCPITRIDATEMLQGIKAKKLLDEIRGLPAVNREALCDILMAISKISTQIPDVTQIDINPILFDGDMPVAADALVKIG